jgi:hypothetical protein
VCKGFESRGITYIIYLLGSQIYWPLEKKVTGILANEKRPHGKNPLKKGHMENTSTIGKKAMWKKDHVEKRPVRCNGQ